ncbi:hypothetical protein QZH41_014951 [Actinostola sp. cb2023]|nr:hypothetical protein QZH41_014951 [Actinostola sp. cb2023]
MLKDILVKRFDCFHDRPKAFSLPKPLDNMIGIVKGESWRKIRNTLSPSFSAHKLKAMVPMINTTCDILLNKIEEVSKTKESFDILGYQQALTLDIVMSTSFGLHTEFQINADDPVFKMAIAAMKPGPLQAIANIVLPLFPYGERFAFSRLGGRLFFKDMLDLCALAQDVVDERRKKESSRKDFLDSMLNATNPDTSDNKKLSDEELIAQLIGFLLAGHETTSTTLALVCYNLATKPDVQERLQQEIDRVWTDEDEMPSYDMVHELPYLDMVMSETLRLYTLGFMLLRECTKECVIKGIKISKDTPILVPVYSIHRDPNIYPNPETFDPERFSAEAKQSRDPFLYLAFGHGPRNCIATRFAQIEVKLVLVRLLKKYSFVVTPETKIPPSFGIKTVLTVTGDITLGARKRAEYQNTG